MKEKVRGPAKEDDARSRVDDDDDQDGPDTPLDLSGFETMRETFGSGENKRVVLVSKGVTLKQLLADSK
jgi:hypothetical protein